MKSLQVSRADLLRCLHQSGDDEQALDSQAERLGYEKVLQRQLERVDPVVLPEPVPVDKKPSGSESNQETSESPKRSHLHFWIPAKLEVRPRAEVDRLYEMPEKYRLPEGFQPDYSWDDQPLPTPPLVPWSRLWPFLQRVLGTHRPGRAVDLYRLIQRLGKGQPIQRVPRRPRRRWNPKVQILVDRRIRMAPFWDDYSDLIQRLERLRGTAGLTVSRLRWNAKADDLGEAWIEHRWGEEEGEGRPYRPPSDDTVVLVLGDLGMLSGSTNRMAAWERLGRELRHRRIRPWALVPCPRYRWLPRMSSVWRMAEWDRGRRLPRSRDGLLAVPLPEKEMEARIKQRMEFLGVLVSPAVRVERALLREIRLSAGRHLDAGAEYDLWASDGVYGAVRAFSFKGPDSQAYRARLKQLPEAPLAAAVMQIRRHHRQAERVFGPAEVYALKNYLAPEQWQGLVDYGCLDSDDWERARSHYHRLVGQLAASGRVGREELARWGAREISRLPKSALATDAFQSIACLTRKVLGGTDKPVPDYVDPDKTAWIDGLLEAERPIYLGLEANGVTVGGSKSKYPVGELKSRASRVWYTSCRKNEASVLRDLLLPQGGRIEESESKTSPADGRSLAISSDRECLHLTGLERPAWAKRLGRDRFGVFADLSVEGASLRMRWIPPGRFMMGEGEARREVVLTLGFWLAETQTTQAFWDAVGAERQTGNRFTGSQRPVERVSWRECVSFCRRLEGRLEGLRFGLPTEAQWEYACRAGTETAFNNGSDSSESMKTLGRCSLNQEGAEDGTAEVGLFEANAFGLFDMHGNVWEWCLDGRKADAVDGDMDPLGAVAKSAKRVIRGGGWSYSARRCRSACRVAISPGYRSNGVGFRLAAGQMQASGALGLWAEGAEAPSPWDRGSAISLSSGASRPPWATAVRHDEYGIIADVAIEGVVFSFRHIPAGTFLMGSPENEPGRYSNEGPQHSVTLSRAFWLGLTPVTQAQWQAIHQNQPSYHKGENRPVEQVSWGEVQSYCAVMNERVKGMSCGLPTEAQWEYACRAGRDGPFNDGSVCNQVEELKPALESLGWFWENSSKETAAVKQKKPNHWGLYDMHGNVLEWCADGQRDYTDEPVMDPVGPTSALRVIRGGGWGYSALDCRSAYRSAISPVYRDIVVGFRLAAGLELSASR